MWNLLDFNILTEDLEMFITMFCWNDTTFLFRHIRANQL